MPDLHEPVEDPGPEIDRADELREKWQTERGQVWEVGRHRLMCGDATSETAHSQLIGMATIDLVLTDPPYGVGVDYGDFADTESNVQKLIDDFMPLVLRHRVVLLIPGQYNLWDYPKPRWVLSWNIPAGGGLNPWGFTTWHAVLAYGKDPYLARSLGSRPDGITMMATRNQSVEGHPVIKPLDVWAWFLERGSPARDERVLDPFLGSGTTMVAAEQLGRICYGMEIEPKYVAVALERLAGMGLEPKLVTG
jgi:DNA modification methylase